MFQLGRQPRKRDPREKTRHVSFPGDGGGGGREAAEESAISDDAKEREQECADLALEDGERGEVAEVAKDEAAGANMVCAASNEPGGGAAEDDARGGDEGEFAFAAGADDCAKDEQGRGVRRKMMK